MPQSLLWQSWLQYKKFAPRADEKLWYVQRLISAAVQLFRMYSSLWANWCPYPKHHTKFSEDFCTCQWNHGLIFCRQYLDKTLRLCTSVDLYRALTVLSPTQNLIVQCYSDRFLLVRSSFIVADSKARQNSYRTLLLLQSTMFETALYSFSHVLVSLNKRETFVKECWECYMVFLKAPFSILCSS